MSLRLYDTLTREKRPFEPVTPGKAGMYVCGMTVQDKPHVGHIRSSIVGDTLRRWLEQALDPAAGFETAVDAGENLLAKALGDRSLSRSVNRDVPELTVRFWI